MLWFASNPYDLLKMGLRQFGVHTTSASSGCSPTSQPNLQIHGRALDETPRIPHDLFKVRRTALPIIGTWTSPADRRCDCKVPYRYITTAEKAARKVSQRTGELIIAYECPDCGCFHIGHADKSQIIVREQQAIHRSHLPSSCPHCGSPIPEERRRASVASGNPNVYCSNTCRVKGGKKARHARRAAQVASKGLDANG